MLHDSGKHQRRRKRNRERIGYREVMLLKTVFLDMEVERVVKVAEECLAEMVALGDDDGVLVAIRRESLQYSDNLLLLLVQICNITIYQ